MPDQATHIKVAALTGAALHFINRAATHDPLNPKPFNWGDFLLDVGACTLGGIAADVGEPADTPNHRGFYHSVAGAALAHYAWTKLRGENLSPEAKHLLGVLLAGHVTHLVLDSGTPNGLPLI